MLAGFFTRILEPWTKAPHVTGIGRNNINGLMCPRGFTGGQGTGGLEGIDSAIVVVPAIVFTTAL